MGNSILEAARKSQGISQVQLARKAKTFQANISMTESGATDPGISTVERYLSPLGFTLLAIPTTKSAVAEIAIRIGESVKENKFARAFRLIIQLHDDLKSVEPGICVALTVAPAPSTGSVRHDALLAGIVEKVLSERKLPIPKWVSEDSRRLPEPWVVDKYETEAKLIAVRTPKALLKHNVILDVQEFESV